MPKKANANALSILLLKEEYPDLQSALKEPHKANLKSETIDGTAFTLATRKPSSNPPKWLSVFGGTFSEELQSLYTASSSAILSFVVNDRRFVIPFGYGRSLLISGSHEENFGLKVVLNSVKTDKLRSIDAKNFEAVSINQRSQASKATHLSNFGIDIEKDILCAATGESEIAELGKMITGKDAIKVVLPTSIEKLPELATILLEMHRSDKYKENFSWIDNLIEVRSTERINSLNEKLIEQLKGGHFSLTWLSIPDVIEWEQVEGFKIGGKRKEVREDITWEYLFQDFVDRSAVSIPHLKSHDVFCIGRESQEIIHQWQIYRCIYAEIESEKKTYTLNNGTWYCVEPSFSTSVNDFYEKLPKSDLTLQAYSHKDEGAYNLDVAKDARFALCDKKNISYGGGHSKIEFCDLFSSEGKIIHIKRYGGSSVLSHLFSQGVVSARLMLSEQGFRENVRGILAEPHKSLITKAKLNPASFEVIFGIISNTKDEKLPIPLFSKITLKHAVTTLQTMGLSVKILVIPADNSVATNIDDIEAA